METHDAIQNYLDRILKNNSSNSQTQANTIEKLIGQNRIGLQTLGSDKKEYTEAE